MEQSTSTPYPTPSVKLVIGIFLTALGLLLTLDNFRVLNADQYLRWAPAILIVIGLIKLSDPTSRGVATVLILGGALLTTWSAGSLRVSIFDLWPLILIGGGVFVVLQSLGFRTKAASIDANAPQILSVFGNREESIASQNYKGGRVAAFLSNIELDLTRAGIEGGPAVLEVIAFMASVELRVPDEWEVVGDALPIMGGIEIKTRAKSTGRQLIVRGLIMWGSVEVKS